MKKIIKPYKRPSRTYSLTLIKLMGTKDYIEVLTGFVEDLVYRMGTDLIWRGSVWDVETNLNRTHMSRSFVDFNGIRHHVKEFEVVGNGDPYKEVDVILVEASAFGLRDKVDQMAKTYMLQGIPTVDSYLVAYDYWTDF